MSIEHFHRREHVNPIDTIRVDKGACVEQLWIRDLSLENHTQSHCPKLTNHGTIQTLRTEGLPAEEIENTGGIVNLRCT